MIYVLDTTAVVALLHGNRLVYTRILQESAQGIGMSAIVAHEVYFGAYLSARASESLAIADRLSFEILPFTREDARQAAQVRCKLENSGRRIGPYDALIAGQALSRRLILITHNTREFSRVEGLTVEDWEV